MSQPSGPFRQYDGGNNGLNNRSRDIAPQIYSVSIVSIFSQKMKLIANFRPYIQVSMYMKWRLITLR